MTGSGTFSRNVVLYLVARFCSATALAMLRAAIAWQVFDLSRSAFPRVVAAASTNTALALATGPAVCGLVIADFGVGAAYAVVAVLVLVSLVALVALEAPLAQSGRAPGWSAIREGLSFVRRNPVVLGCMTLDMLAVAFGGAAALLPIYATDILHVGARGYGFLASAL